MYAVLLHYAFTADTKYIRYTMDGECRQPIKHTPVLINTIVVTNQLIMKAILNR